MFRQELARPLRYLADKVVDVLMYIAISSVIASIPYLVLPTLPPGLVFLSVGVAAFAGMLLVFLLTPYLDRLLAKRRGMKKITEIEKEQGFELCAKRDEPIISTLLKDAKDNSQVWVLGRDCSRWLDEFADRIGEYVSEPRNLSFTFILAAAPKEANSIQLAEDATLIDRQSPEARNKCLQKFNSMRKGLGNKAGKVRLGIYDLPPLHSMTVINPDTKDEQIVVNHYLYDIDALERPTLVLRKSQLPEQLRGIFGRYHKSIKYAKDKATFRDGF